MRGSTLEELHAALDARGYAGSGAERLERIERLRSEWNDEVDRVLHLAATRDVSQPEVIRLVNEAAGEDGVVVAAAGGLPGDLHKIWRASGPHSYHMEYGYSTMGYEVAGGLGVAMAEPDRRVYVMLGDGSYLMLANEIATAYQEGISMTVVILDNHGFRCIRNLSGACGGDNAFNDFRVRDRRRGSFSGEALPIDYRGQCRQPRCQRADRRTRPRELEAALARPARSRGARSPSWWRSTRNRPCPDYDSWWDVPVAEVSTSERVRAARKGYEANLAKGTLVRLEEGEPMSSNDRAAASRSRPLRCRGASSRRPRAIRCSWSPSRCSTRWPRPVTPVPSSARPATSARLR